MKIAALDSSGLVASVAVMEDDNLIAEYTIQHKKTHSQTLLPMLEAIVNMIELDMTAIDAIAVAAGPGSFTGLRIGSATAKGLGLALGKPIIGIPTVDALAYNLYGTDILVCPLMDARRGQVYTGIYEFRKMAHAEPHRGSLTFEFCTIVKQCAATIEETIEKLNSLRREVIFVGDGVPVFEEKLQERLTVPYHLAPAHRNRQSAASLAALAGIYYSQGRMECAAEHQPDYLRMTQAERERLDKA